MEYTYASIHGIIFGLFGMLFSGGINIGWTRFNMLYNHIQGTIKRDNTILLDQFLIVMQYRHEQCLPNSWLTLSYQHEYTSSSIIMHLSEFYHMFKPKIEFLWSVYLSLICLIKSQSCMCLFKTNMMILYKHALTAQQISTNFENCFKTLTLTLTHT